MVGEYGVHHLVKHAELILLTMFLKMCGIYQCGLTITWVVYTVCNPEQAFTIVDIFYSFGERQHNCI